MSLPSHEILFRKYGAISFGLVLLTLSFVSTDAIAQNSLGLGGSEQSIRPDGMFAGWLYWIQQKQQDFYKAMTKALVAMKSEPSNLVYLVGLSFAYGIFHAAGPGHGKAVISSYMLANEVAARRGILLSFASAFLQGLTAIVVIGVIVIAPPLMGIGITELPARHILMASSAFIPWILAVAVTEQMSA